ncbi:MAG: CapA family protein [Treponema sp.]|jgi:poly-gamma-glutamate synthesis protein (capsule biosynthesis protein)|nr:CapA family protein [Treponema sp.]
MVKIVRKLYGLLIFIILISCKNTKQEPIAEPEINPRHNLTLIATGDNLFHITLINSHKQKDGSYDFNPIYTEIKELVQSADLAFINQETVMAGTRFGYSGYPAFNSPQSLAYTVKDTGFSIVNIANNHTMDMGRSGLHATLDFLEEIKGITVIGARTKGVSFRLFMENNIILGFLSYTYGLNGIPLPPEEPNLVSVINRTKMTQEINELRPLCDFLIVSMHWGEEYRLVEPDFFQKDLAVFLAQHNVDLIIGHHPHVLQRVELLPRPDGKQTLCFYSLGNFVSHQREKDRVLGGIMAVTFTKDGEELSISDYGLIPVVTHFENGYSNTKVYPYYSYTEDLLKKHLLHTRDNTMTFEYYKGVLNRLNTKIIMYNPF